MVAFQYHRVVGLGAAPAWLGEGHLVIADGAAAVDASAAVSVVEGYVVSPVAMPPTCSARFLWDGVSVLRRMWRGSRQ